MPYKGLFFSAAFLAATLVSAQTAQTVDTAVSAIRDSGRAGVSDPAIDAASVKTRDSAAVPELDTRPGAAVGPTDTVSPYDATAPSTIVVTAARRAQPSEWVSNDHLVIDVEKFARAGSKSIPELLVQSVPAYFADYGGNGTKNISLRGAGSERTLVLLDGKRIGTVDGDLADIPVEIVESIEIVEGGQSALYGMDAVGGVVNIRTKRTRPSGPFAHLSTSMGSFEPSEGRPRLNAARSCVTAGINGGQVDWLGSLNFLSSDGRYDYEDVFGNHRPREHNGGTDWGLYQKLSYGRDGLAIGLSGGISDRASDNPGMTISPNQSTMEKKLRYAVLDGSWAANRYAKLNLNAAYSYDSTSYNDTYQKSRHAHSKQDVEFTQEFTLEKQMVNTGIQIVRDTVASNEYGNHAMEQASAFANGIVACTAGEFTFRGTPAARFDYSTVYKGAANAKVGLMATWNNAAEPSLFVNFGTASRGPTMKDLYWPRDAWTVGNPHLKPEKSWDADAALQARFTSSMLGMSGRVTGYYMLLSDMIQWLPDSIGQLWSPENIDSVSVLGCKIGLHVRYTERWNGSVEFARNDARNAGSKTTLIYKPKYLLTCSGSWSEDRFAAGVSGRYSSRMFTDDKNTDSLCLPASFVVDANIGCKVVRLGGDDAGMWLVYDILNITNAERIANKGYPLPGREHRIGLKMNF